MKILDKGQGISEQKMIPSDIGITSPKFPEFRPKQLELAQYVAETKTKFSLIDAPTGVGKSLLAMAAHKLLGGKAIYLCKTKQLQDQIVEDFGDMVAVIKGRKNYPCLLHDDDFPDISAEDCLLSRGKKCGFVEECPYLLAKRRAVMADLVVMNITYFLTETSTVESQFTGRDFLIVDEVDTMESELMDHVHFSVSENGLTKLHLDLPESNVDNMKSFLVWMMKAQVDLRGEMKPLQDQIERMPPEAFEHGDLIVQRRLRNMKKLYSKLDNMFSMIDSEWVFDRVEGKNTVWQVKPIFVSQFGDQYIWRHTKKVLGMSATILDANIMAANIGISRFTYRKMQSPFPVANRPIYYQPVANVVRNNMDNALPLMAKKVTSLIADYPNDKVLVHTVSYATREYLMDHVKPISRLITHNTIDRSEKIDYFKKTKRPLVMITPSFDRGVDLAGDACRAVIIVKCPWGYLGDSQIKARMDAKGGYMWYFLQGAQTIVQMSGRGVRSVDDYCTTYILDEQFKKKFTWIKKFVPDWWLAALVKK